MDGIDRFYREARDDRHAPSARERRRDTWLVLAAIAIAVGLFLSLTGSPMAGRITPAPDAASMVGP